MRCFVDFNYLFYTNKTINKSVNFILYFQKKMMKKS